MANRASFPSINPSFSTTHGSWVGRMRLADELRAKMDACARAAFESLPHETWHSNVPKTKYSEILQHGQKSHLKGDFKAATNSFIKAFVVALVEGAGKPEKILILEQLGKAALADANPEEAIRAYNKALFLAQELYGVEGDKTMELRGLLSALQRVHPKSTPQDGQVVSWPNLPAPLLDILHNLGVSYLLPAQPRTSVPLVKSRITKEAIEGYQSLASALFDKENPMKTSEKLGYFGHGVYFTPSNPRKSNGDYSSLSGNWVELGDLHFALGDFKGAIEAYRSARDSSEISDGKASILLKLGKAYVADGDSANALATFTQVLKIDHDAYGASHPCVALVNQILNDLYLKYPIPPVEGNQVVGRRDFSAVVLNSLMSVLEDSRVPNQAAPYATIELLEDDGGELEQVPELGVVASALALLGKFTLFSS